jgi:HEAT repeat protein
MTTPITGREPVISRKTKTRRRLLSRRALGAMLHNLPPDKISLDALAAGIEHEDFFVRHNAAKLLSDRGDRDARLVLENALRNSDAPTRARAARFLHGWSWHTVSSLVDLALADPDERVQEAVIYTLCSFHSPNAYTRLTESLAGSGDSFKAAAIWGLSKTTDPEALPAFAEILTADNFQIRVDTLEALGANGFSQALPLIKACLDDPDEDVKYAAALTWLELTQEEGLPEIAETIRNATGPTRKAILKGFFHATNYLGIDLGGSEHLDVVLAALMNAVQDDEIEIRMAALRPLVWVRNEKATMLLRDLFSNEKDPLFKAQIVYYTFALLSEIGEELLEQAAQAEEEPVREMAMTIQQAVKDGTVSRIYKDAMRGSL